MSRRRRWVTFTLGFGVLVAAAGIGWAVWGEDLRYRDALVKYQDNLGEPNEYVNLDYGDAQLSIGSPDGHRIVAQWRDPDGHGWTEPETVWTDQDAAAIDNTVRHGGGTVAVLEVFTTDVHSDSDVDSLTVAIICRDLSCEAQRAPGFGGEAQVTPSEPVLAPDGSLRVVTSRPSPDRCTFKLLTSAPRTADLTSVAHSTERLRGRAQSDCRSYLETYSAEWVEVHPDDHRARDFWFVRDREDWTATRDDPSGRQRAPGP